MEEVDKAMRILAVDADVPSLKLMELLLRPLRATVTRAQSSHEALALARNHPYDLIILDVDLPGIGGLELAQAVRADPKLVRIPILATAFDAVSRTAEILRAGCQACVPKPLDARAFPKVIRSLIAQ